VLLCPHSHTFYATEHNYGVFIGLNASCPNDPLFYQMCGFEFDGSNMNINNGDGILCETIICETSSRIYISIHLPPGFGHWQLPDHLICNGEHDCINTEIDEANCEQKKPSQICDDKCDVEYCRDEGYCNGYSYGIFCTETPWLWENHFVPPMYVCNGFTVLSCSDYSDEVGCDGSTIIAPPYSTTQQQDSTVLKSTCRNDNKTLFNFTRCAPFVYTIAPIVEKEFSLTRSFKTGNFPYCSDYSDQTNCTDISIVGLRCYISGFLSTIAHRIICTGLNITPLCDDASDLQCLDVSSICHVHKHLMCDGELNCEDGTDESSISCRTLTNKTCARKGGKAGEQQIPLSWLDDGIEDCLNGIDEQGGWSTCGFDDTRRYVVSNSSCEEVFICPYSATRYVLPARMCDGLDTCGNENAVCSKSYGATDIFVKALSKRNTLHFTILSAFETRLIFESEKLLLYCIKGLEGIERLANSCLREAFQFPQHDIYGLNTATTLYLPDSKVNCDHTFGETYLYLSCTDRCINSVCPLTRTIQYDSCPGKFSKTVKTLANNEYLTLLTKSRRGNLYRNENEKSFGDETFYRNDYFLCRNNDCVDYDKVCDLVDDCGDASDEEMCTNSFKCNSSNDYIPVTDKCNGIIDCLDLSDECNENCDKSIISGTSLKVISWTIGFLAVLLNIIIVTKNTSSFKSCRTSVALFNKTLVSLISLGDLLVGIYLMLISYIDSITYRSKGSYCQSQLDWLTSSECSYLGIISTMGSQVSLFAMTILSLTRFLGIKNAMNIPGPVSRAAILKVSIISILIFTCSMSIAAIPVFQNLKDFFVNGMKYDTSLRLFIGFPDKQMHFNIIQEYYGRMKKRVLSWDLISTMVDGMFSNDYGALNHETVDFYGNDGVCLFKYFVKPDDPQRNFVWAILAINFTCFVVITFCYVVINFLSTQSSRQLTKGIRNDAIRNRDRKMQRKIFIIITTDFCCWIPFVVICCLHSLEVLDATPWYALFSIIILPINSVINPILYDTTITTYFDRFNRATVQLYRVAASTYSTAMTTVTGKLPVTVASKSGNNGDVDGIQKAVTSEEQPCLSTQHAETQL